MVALALGMCVWNVCSLMQSYFSSITQLFISTTASLFTMCNTYHCWTNKLLKWRTLLFEILHTLCGHYMFFCFCKLSLAPSVQLVKSLVFAHVHCSSPAGPVIWNVCLYSLGLRNFHAQWCQRHGSCPRHGGKDVLLNIWAFWALNEIHSLLFPIINNTQIMNV